MAQVSCNHITFIRLRTYLLATLLVVCTSVIALAGDSTISDSLDERARKLADEALVKSKQKVQLTIQNVDIKRFPEVSLIVEAMNENGEPLDSLDARDLSVVENGRDRKIISVRKISVKERVPVDFIIVLDVTGTMQVHINGIRDNIQKFTSNLVARGIDYRLGLVMFSDVIEKTFPPTADVNEFMTWIASARAWGGFDEKENALEALKEASNAEFRPSANRVLVMISDAPYHQQGERGNGRTNFTTESIIAHLKEKQARVFCIVPPVLEQYSKIARETRGTIFDLNQSFGKILDAYSTQLTNLFAITFRSDQPAIPDSINVAVLNSKKQELLRKTIPLVEIGRKLIIEDLLFPSASATLPENVPTLEILTEFLRNQPKVIIRIEGHTDNRGLASSNRRLSLVRAESVKKYLVEKKQISPKRIQTVGYGDARPIADNATEFGRNLNRRTEVVIVSK
ncbi:MAG: OmpA family protein [Candidatus Kapabacteria bacterium]|nr:OmpA family protein [Candidatus Kapabacteria bacterium]